MITIGNLNVLVDYAFNGKQQRVVKTFLFNGEGKFLAQGKATCSKEDNFCKNTGRKEALRRAFASDKTLSKEQRSKFWESYRKDMTKNTRW